MDALATKMNNLTSAIKRRMWICFLFGGILLAGGSVSGANFDLVGLNVAQFGGFLVACVSYWVIHMIRHFEGGIEREKVDRESSTKKVL